MKAILATGELGSLRNVGRASMVAMMAGADFIKTSTGKEAVNATLPVSLVMVRAIRAYHERTGYMVGYKPAGGISKAKDALTYLSMMQEELGRRWQEPDLFRFGASSLLGDIERQLEHHVTGRYSAAQPPRRWPEERADVGQGDLRDHGVRPGPGGGGAGARLAQRARPALRPLHRRRLCPGRRTAAASRR